jgi:hypothetical protein
MVSSIHPLPGASLWDRRVEADEVVGVVLYISKLD